VQNHFKKGRKKFSLFFYTIGLPEATIKINFRKFNKPIDLKVDVYGVLSFYFLNL